MVAGNSMRGSVDEILGPRESRFFGEGFKGVEYEAKSLLVIPAEPGVPTRIDALAAITFPEMWSIKGATKQQPHLSTVDLLVLGAQFAEAAILHSRGLTPEERRGMRLREVLIRAGKRPQERGLDGIHVRGQVTATQNADSPGMSLTTVTCSIATMTVTCTVLHATGRPVATTAAFDSLADALGDPTLRTYGTIYKSVRQIIDGIHIADNVSATATMTLDYPTSIHAGQIGLDACAVPSVLDVFVAGLQLGQILLYQLDQVPRAESNTLWMRRTLLVSEPAALHRCADILHISTAVDTALVNLRLLPFHGRMWRSADIEARVGNAAMRCSVAHQLPAPEVDE